MKWYGVHLTVCPSMGPQQQTAAAMLLLWATQAGDID